MDSKQADGDGASKVRFLLAKFSHYFLNFSVCSVVSMDLFYIPRRWRGHAGNASMVHVVASVVTQTEGT